MMKNLLFVMSMIFSFQLAFSQTVIRMEKVNGVYQIPCEVNGIEMKFIFDTGAYDISISKTEANFLAKQGLLEKEDIIGTQKYRTADGTISEGTKILIKEIKIKDLFFNNVTAIVVDNANAPLLFGQSVLSKFGRYEIENDILRIYPKENRNDFGTGTLNEGVKKVEITDGEVTDEAVSKDLAELMTLSYRESPVYGNWNLNASSNNKTLYFNMESEVLNISPNAYDDISRKKFKEIEFTMSKDMAFNLYKIWMTLIKLDSHIEFWNEMVFDFYFSYADGSNTSIKYSLSSEDFLAIGEFVTKQKFDQHCDIVD